MQKTGELSFKLVIVSWLVLTWGSLGLAESK